MGNEEETRIDADQGSETYEVGITDSNGARQSRARSIGEGMAGCRRWRRSGGEETCGRSCK